MAVFSTITASFAGGGASMIMFPLIMMFLGCGYLPALTVTKVAATLMTYSSVFIHSKRSKINWDLMLTLVIAGLFGTSFGTYLVQYQLNEELFKGILGVSLLVSVVYLLFSRNLGINKTQKRKIDLPVLIVTTIFALFINVLNGLFGGVGIFLTLYLVAFMRMTFIESMIYTMLSFAVISTFQTFYLVMEVDFSWTLALFVALGGLFGGILGTKLQYLKGNLWVKRAAILVMLAVGVRVLWGIF